MFGVERSRAERVRDGLAVEGLARVTDALRQANVDTPVVNTGVLAAVTGANVVVGDDVQVLQGVGAILRHRP
ncbi:hypothetical protein [Lentzea californiensis]|uniref:hypothetical protein n=1 Tax=Lentzea californiensis TaxID=438851 RepID=UPI0021669844|nr:hypothetical protein [Lentzea californiensis]MCR3750453.1 hypothetical protein [Lentzea californiensis]